MYLFSDIFGQLYLIILLIFNYYCTQAVQAHPFVIRRKDAKAESGGASNSQREGHLNAPPDTPWHPSSFWEGVSSGGVFMDVLLTDSLLRKSGFPLGPFHENHTALEHCSDCWGVLRVPGDFFEPIRRELKIPRRDLCLLSGKTERKDQSGLRTSSRRKTEEFIIRYSWLKISDMPRGAFKALRPCAA